MTDNVADCQKRQDVAWVSALFQSFGTAPLKRLKLVATTRLPAGAHEVVRAHVEYDYRDARGRPAIGKAKLYLPGVLEEQTAKLPLYFAAGYEINDEVALAQAGEGFVVVNPRELLVNPMVRTINPESALLHIARALPFVDDARVVIGGFSAGGHATLLLA